MASIGTPLLTPRAHTLGSACMSLNFEPALIDPRYYFSVARWCAFSGLDFE